MSKSKLEIRYRPTVGLQPCERNARKHSKAQIRQIANSIEAFGFTNPVLVRGNMIVAGHGRVLAAKLLDMSEIPTVELQELSDDQIRAYVLADNKIAANSSFDEDLLKLELQHLLTLDLDFDITLTGFAVAEIDMLIQEESADEEELIELEEGPPVTRSGDLWQLGDHRIFCGSSLLAESYQKLMGNERARVVFTDPPFNVPIAGHASGNGAIRHEDFAMACGEMSTEQFTKFLTESLAHMASYSTDGAAHYVCMDWRHQKELLEAGERVYSSLLNMCVWAKTSAGMGSFYSSQHELIFVFRKGSAAHLNNIQLGRYGRDRTNVWEYPSINTLSKHGEEGNLLALHPTVKPVAMIADALLDCSAPKDIVLDGFLGSGSTLMAAEKTGRACMGIELSPKYVDTAIRRWQRSTGKQAVHALSGVVYDSQASLEMAHA